MAMLIPTLPGWKVETVGDDIAWMKFGDDGRLYAINPEAGFFGVAPGTGEETNPNAMQHAVGQLHLHQRRQDRRRRRLVGGPDRRAAGAPHRLEGQRLDARVRHAGRPPQRPLHRPGVAVPVDRPRVGGPEGRADLGHPLRRPPRHQRPARDRGASTGSTACSSARSCRSEKTAAAAGTVGEVRFDPFAMLPFCGYNMGDYFGHWLEIGKATDAAKLPKLFWVNWFRKGDDGTFLWPGFGENSRVLKWVVERVDRRRRRRRHADRPGAHRRRASTSTGLDLDDDDDGQLLAVDTEAWRAEVPQIEDHFEFIGERLPDELRDELERAREAPRQLTLGTAARLRRRTPG